MLNFFKAGFRTHVCWNCLKEFPDNQILIADANTAQKYCFSCAILLNRMLSENDFRLYKEYLVLLYLGKLDIADQQKLKALESRASLEQKQEANIYAGST